jgi:hypothetical protein
MTTNTIIIKDSVFRVKCPRIEEFKNAMECKKCHLFVSIDPVKGVIKCRGDK